ncbi:MAG: ATP-binding protein [Elusimicrobiota bacterium]
MNVARWNSAIKLELPFPSGKRPRSRAINFFATAIYVKNRGHRCVMLNDECCRLLGQPREALLGKTDYDFLPKNRAAKLWKDEELMFATGGERYDEESVADHRGAARTYATTKAVFTDRRGGSWLVGVVGDITAHKRALDDCNFMRGLLQARNEASIAGLLVVDGAGRILAVNRRFREMWGIPGPLLTLKSDAPIQRLLAKQTAAPEEYLGRVVRLYRHRNERCHQTISLRDGRIFDRYSAPVVGDDGFYYGRYWSFKDVTEMRKVSALKAEIETARKLNEQKDQIIGTVSHELRTPLTVVRTAMDTLRGSAAGTLSAKQQELADLGCRNVIRLGKMIDNLLDISRLKSGKAKARLERLDLGSLLAEMSENFRMMRHGKNLSIKLDAPSTLPKVRGDSEMIGEVLYNLLDNAARFARSEVRVKVRQERGPTTAREAAGVSVAIVDDGPGISAEHMGLLFNEFSQIDRPVGGGYKGTGLGLAICKEIMALHGSKIAVESVLGRGASFRFFLPEWTPRLVAARTTITSSESPRCGNAAGRVPIRGRGSKPEARSGR